MIQHNVGIPTTIFIGREYDKDNVPIADEECDDIRRKIMAKAGEMFGGVTVVDAKGVWVDPTGGAIEESVLQVIVYSRGPRDLARPHLVEFIQFILSVSRQTSVLVDNRASPEAYLAFSDSPGSDGG